MSDAELAMVPAHTRTAMPHSEQGSFCSCGETMAPNGRCPDGCDHEAHYANDGHPECDESRSLAEMVARSRNSSATDPSWRTDYRS